MNQERKKSIRDSKRQKKVWAGRSQKERSAIAKKILETRSTSLKWRRFLRNASKIVGEHGFQKGNKPWNVGKEGYKIVVSPEGRKRLREVGRRNGQNPELHKHRLKTFKRNFLASLSPERLKAYKKEKRERNKLRRLRENDPEGYQKEISRRLSRGTKRVWSNLELRARMSAKAKASWADPERRKKRMKYLTPAYLKRFSAIMKKCYKMGPGARKAWYQGNGKRIHMFSGAEVRYAKWLDSQGVEWLYEAFTFAVKIFGAVKHWTPDFYLVKEKTFVEIKGQEHPHLVKKYGKVIKHYSATKFEILPDIKIPRILVA